jgi:hypothetical protein
MLGQVGSLTVDAESGEVRFSEEDRGKLEARAEQLVDASSL